MREIDENFARSARRTKIDDFNHSIRALCGLQRSIQVNRTGRSGGDLTILTKDGPVSCDDTVRSELEHLSVVVYDCTILFELRYGAVRVKNGRPSFVHYRSASVAPFNRTVIQHLRDRARRC